MVVCRYYLQGRCRYGDRCWNEHTDSSPAPQRRDNYTWVSPSVASSRNYPQTQSSRGNFSSQYREPGPRYNYGNDYSQYREPSPRNNYSNDYSWSTSTSRNQYSASGYNDNRGSESYERSKQNTYFQAKPSNRFDVLSQSKDTGKNDKDSGLILTVKNDITEWEGSHIWPFSCHSHFKDLGLCLSGFVDLSPEELRCRAYEAENSGSFELYIGIVAEAMNEVKKKWDVLKNPTADVLQSINGYEGTPDFCAENLKKLIGENATAGSFGGQVVDSGMFVQHNSAPESSGSFSFKQAHLNSPQSMGSSISAFKSVFPSTNKVESSFPAFGAPSSLGPAFGVPSSSGPAFGVPSSSGPAFGTPSSSGFGSPSASAFASTSTSVSSGFGSSKERQDGNTKTRASSEIKSCAYTLLEDLTESEKAQFASQTFTLGKIPSRPPPVEFCF